MPRWFVYFDVEFYPWAEIVEADTAEQAAARLSDYQKSKGTMVAVAPIDGVRFVHPDGDEAETMRFVNGLIAEGER